MKRSGVCAAIVESPAQAGTELLDEALRAAGFWPSLETAFTASGLPPDQFSIVVKPELEAFERGSASATDPRLVEHLIDRLHEHGYPAVNVCASAASAYFWAENRDVAVLADLLGYHFVTPSGHAYDVLDLGERLEPAAFREGGVLHGSGLAKPWLNAGFRICFASNQTDEREGYALGLHSLLGILPQADKDYYYRHRIAPGEAVADLLDVAGVHFALIDAIVSAHGSGGRRAPRAIATGCIIASPYAPLADFVGALKMGLDPYVSTLAGTVFHRCGLPRQYAIIGNLAPYPLWQNVHAALLDAHRKRDRVPAASRLVTPWLQVLDTELFPLKRLLDARLNPRVSRFFAATDDNPAASTLLLALNYAIAASGEWLRAYRVLYDKDTIRRGEVPLGFDPRAFDDAAYAAIRPELEQLETLLAGTMPATPALRWREINGATIFQFEHELPVPFDVFVTRVEVARTIQFMNDYIGGIVVPMRRDGVGRVLLQTERNLYLPQPNYLVLYQGQEIDVSKIEICDYSDDRHRMYWKTIKSENGSATHDDGAVSFTRSERGTRVRIVGRQQFTLPPFWQAVNLELLPELKAALVTHAYTAFFERTIANFEALVEGREIRIGRPWHTPRDSFDTEPFPAETLERLILRLIERVESLLAEQGSDWLPPRSRAAPVLVDADGFRHFAGAGTARNAGAAAPPALAIAGIGAILSEFLLGLSEALARDAAPGAGAAAGGTT